MYTTMFGCVMCMLISAAAAAGLPCGAPCQSWAATGLQMPIEGTAEWLPPNASAWFGDECLRNASRAVSSVAFSKRDNTTVYAGPWRYTVTIGKYAEFPIVWFLRASLGGYTPSFKVPEIRKTTDSYASLSTCTRENAFHCMFGRFEPGEWDGCAERDWAAVAAGRMTFASVFYAGVIASIMVPKPWDSDNSVKLSGAPLEDGRFVTVHVRRGDACDRWVNESAPYTYHFFDDAHKPANTPGGRPCYPWDAYRKALQSMQRAYFFKTALILTEDDTVITEAQQTADEDGYSYAWLQYDRSRMQHGRAGFSRGQTTTRT